MSIYIVYEQLLVFFLVNTPKQLTYLCHMVSFCRKLQNVWPFKCFRTKKSHIINSGEWVCPKIDLSDSIFRLKAFDTKMERMKLSNNNEHHSTRKLCWKYDSQALESENFISFYNFFANNTVAKDIGAFQLIWEKCIPSYYCRKNVKGLLHSISTLQRTDFVVLFFLRLVASITLIKKIAVQAISVFQQCPPAQYCWAKIASPFSSVREAVVQSGSNLKWAELFCCIKHTQWMLDELQKQSQLLPRNVFDRNHIVCQIWWQYSPLVLWIQPRLCKRDLYLCYNFAV